MPSVRSRLAAAMPRGWRRGGSEGAVSLDHNGFSITSITSSIGSITSDNFTAEKVCSRLVVVDGNKLGCVD